MFQRRLRLLLQRRSCPVWIQHMVDQLQCDSCLESSDAQNAQRVSLATPPKLWQAVKVDIFELEDSQRKGFFALYMDAACKLSSCSCFLERNPRQRFFSSHNNGFKTGGYSPVLWAFGADNEEHGFTTTMPSEIETFQMSQHTTRKENVDLEPGNWVLNFRRAR